MSHPLVLALFSDHASAARGAAAMRQFGVASVDLSIVARDHAEEGRLARAIGGTPGVEIEDSAVAASLGGVWAEAVAAIALVMPGIDPIVGAGPLGAALSEFAGRRGVDAEACQHPVGGCGCLGDADMRRGAPHGFTRSGRRSRHRRGGSQSGGSGKPAHGHVALERVTHSNGVS